MILINKKIGETPLECIERIKATKGRLARLPMTYAGRLDPMAEGLLIILVDEECKEEEKRKFLGLDKVYEFEVLFGVATDTHDVLGLITETNFGAKDMDDESGVLFNKQTLSAEIISKVAKDFLGKRMQKYPNYSSKTVGGRSLFELTRSGEIANIDDGDYPHKEVEIFEIDFLGLERRNFHDIIEDVKEKIRLVNGDFRQREICDRWNEVADCDLKFCIAKFRAKVSSGTYIRVLAMEMGEKLGVPALAYSIKRIQVGDYKLSDII